MPDYVILIFIPLFLLMSVFVLKSLHKKSWNNLQERYLFQSNDFSGEKIKIKSISIDGLSSQNVVKIKISNQGLFMRPSMPFNLFSKPILIPWTEITDVQEKKVMFGKYKRLVIGNPFASTIDIPGKDYNKISKYISVN